MALLVPGIIATIAKYDHVVAGGATPVTLDTSNVGLLLGGTFPFARGSSSWFIHGGGFESPARSAGSGLRNIGDILIQVADLPLDGGHLGG
jgi:hypothetical protein